MSRSSRYEELVPFACASIEPGPVWPLHRLIHRVQQVGLVEFCVADLTSAIRDISRMINLVVAFIFVSSLVVRFGILCVSC